MCGAIADALRNYPLATIHQPLGPMTSVIFRHYSKPNTFAPYLRAPTHDPGA